MQKRTLAGPRLVAGRRLVGAEPRPLLARPLLLAGSLLLVGPWVVEPVADSGAPPAASSGPRPQRPRQQRPRFQIEEAAPLWR